MNEKQILKLEKQFKEMEEKFEDETKAEKGTDPVTTEVKNVEIKIDNIKWRKTDD